MLNLKKFGNNLRCARKYAGLTQKELAEMLGYTSNHLSLLENGCRSPSLSLIFTLSKKLSVSAAKLLDGVFE